MRPYFVSKTILISFVIIFSLISIYFFNVSGLKNLKFNWDETDYANAASKGFIANYTDNESLSISQFIYIGKQKYLNKDFSPEVISQFINEEEDNYHLRHYHPPLPVYYWSLFITDDNTILEKNNNLRVSLLILYLIVVFYFVLIIYYRTRDNLFRLILSLIFLTSFFTNQVIINGFFNLQFHVIYSLILIYHIQSILNLYLKKINYIVICNFILSTSLLLLTLHTSLISLFASVLCFFYLNKKSVNKLSFIRIFKYFASSIALTVILFPAFITKAYYFKIFLTYVYKLVLLRGSEFSNYGNIFDKWINYFLHNNYIFILPLIFIFLSRLNLKKEDQYIYIFLIHGFIYSIFITPFLISFTYILPSLMCIIIFSLYYIFLSTGLDNKIEKFLIILLCFVTIILNFNFINKTKHKANFKGYNDRINNIENLINANNDKNFLIDGAHIYKFYTGNKNIYELSILSRKTPDFFIRKEYNYVSIKDEIINNFYDFIIIQNNRNFTDLQNSFLLSNNYKLIKNDAYNIFKLGHK